MTNHLLYQTRRFRRDETDKISTYRSKLNILTKVNPIKNFQLKRVKLPKTPATSTTTPTILAIGVGINTTKLNQTAWFIDLSSSVFQFGAIFLKV